MLGENSNRIFAYDFQNAKASNLGVSFMATSRPHGNIEERFKSGFPNCKKLQIRASDEDVEKYLLQKMSQSQKLVLRNLALQEDIKIGIIQGS
jgi:hypothetical protein